MSSDVHAKSYFEEHDVYDMAGYPRVHGWNRWKSGVALVELAIIAPVIAILIIAYIGYWPLRLSPDGSATCRAGGRPICQ